MAKITGLTRYICDRCAGNEVIEKGVPSGTWKEINRFDSDGVNHSYLLCGFCANSHVTYKQSEDAAFAAWMASWEEEREGDGTDDGGEQ